MPPIPRVSGKEVVRAFLRSGWEIHRVRGSHHVLKATDGRRVSVPVHADETLPVGTIGGIIDDAGIGVDEFVAMLRGKRA
jgi:predicted RNA binding protein YcfA (HicA-like mRNA interferase family)